jgi:hypothetical protein
MAGRAEWADRIGGGKGVIWFEPRNLQRPLVISHFDGTIFDVIAPKHTEAFSFGIPKKT